MNSWQKARGWKKDTNVSIGICPGCVRKIWPTDKVVRWQKKTWHARCVPEETEKEEETKPQMKGTGGWAGYKMYPTNQPTKDKKDDKSKGFTGGWKQWANHPRPDP